MDSSEKLFNSLGMKVEKDLSHIKIEGDKVIEEDNKDKTTEKINEHVTFKITDATRDACVLASIIPEAYRNTEFDIDRIKANYREQSAGTKRYEMMYFDDYLDVTCKILNTLRTGKKLDRSYIIGAPNGMGKTSFAHTALMLMYERRMQVVPYISLSEIKEIKAENETRLARGVGISVTNRVSEYNITYQNDRADPNRSLSDDISYYNDINNPNYYKKPMIITGQYSWSEYINTDILFCFLSGVSTREVESYILKTILEIRGAKGLPTVVMISTSLNPYKNHHTLGPYVWQEILSYSKEGNMGQYSFDRLEHISCFRVTKGVQG